MRNPKGINGWTKLRDRARERIEQDAESMLDALIELAKDGDVQALRLALGPVLDVKQHEIGGQLDLTASMEDEEAANARVRRLIKTPGGRERVLAALHDEAEG